jgi:protein phosphatase 2C
MSGSTLVVAIVSSENIVLANCGDSRAVVIDSDGKILIETRDHKPEREDERIRIEYKHSGRVKRNF